MMPESEVTVGEIWRRILSLEARLDQGFSRLDRQLEHLQFVHADRYEAEQRSTAARLDALEDKSKWVARTVAAALITMVGTALLMLFTARGGV